MRKNASLPVRLDADVARRLDAAAQKLGLTRSALIRLIVQSFVNQLDANGGKIVLPLMWSGDKPPLSAIPLPQAAGFPAVPKVADSSAAYPLATPRKQRRRKE